jgi:glycosyltransferase involved in cell wall biosynthesis
MPDILLVSDDVVGARMAGPGIRAWEMARVLAGRFDVALAVPEFKATEADAVFFKRAPFEVFTHAAGRPGDLLRRAAAARIVVIQGYILSKYPGLADLARPLVADIYDPFVLENLFIHQRKIPNLRDREAVHLHDLGVFNDLLRRGDHFLVASDRQKDLFAGCLLTLGRIGPEALDADADLERLLSVVPFGIAEDADPSSPAEAKAEFKSLFPQIGDGDILLLWGGVLSDWYDPETLLRALKSARSADARIKLLFLSTGHPNPLVPAMDAVPDARRLAAELGLPAEAVIFNDDWIEYDRRGSVFRRADLGVSIHRTHFETRFAFRTRMLDYIKYGLPIVATEGDIFAEWIEEKKLGRVVRSGDVDDLTRALVDLSANAEEQSAIRGRLAAVRERFLWKNTVAPLVRFCEKARAGEFSSPGRLSRDAVIRVCAGSERPGPGGRLIGRARPLGRRLPPRFRAWIRRFWKG